MIVTILIFLATLLQPNRLLKPARPRGVRYNPYFSGNSFATKLRCTNIKSKSSYNPYFSGNSFATV
ncbi:MAG TPA: hypothetical protein O0X23_00275, partial [Methanocorpusculum sp.]|nr:hypothetical protein [Methanocorpusculum sp.]